jgi:hypothetical protein
MHVAILPINDVRGCLAELGLLIVWRTTSNCPEVGSRGFLEILFKVIQVLRFNENSRSDTIATVLSREKYMAAKIRGFQIN